MYRSYLYSDPITSGIRWAARAGSLLVGGTIILFFIAERAD